MFPASQALFSITAGATSVQVHSAREIISNHGVQILKPTGGVAGLIVVSALIAT